MTTEVKPLLNLGTEAWSMNACGDIYIRLKNNADYDLLIDFVTFAYT